MSMSDPIADLLTRIRNAQMAGKPSVQCPSSKIKQAILEVLKQEGYIAGYALSSDLVKPVLNIDLKYYNGRPVIEELHRGSSPGLRMYKSSSELPKVRAGLGISIVTTYKRVRTGKGPPAAGVGGDVLCCWLW